MAKFRLGLYEIKKSITVSRIVLILLIFTILFIYSRSFDPFDDSLGSFADDILYSLLKEYEVSTGDRAQLFDNDAKEKLCKFYESDDYATSVFRSTFYRIENVLEGYNDAETMKKILASDSIFTTSILFSFHELMFWLTAASSTLIALLCFFLGLREKPEKTEYYSTCLYGKDSARSRHAAVLMCTIVAVLIGAILSFAYYFHRTGAPEVLTEPIYSRYATSVSYQTGNMPFAVYCLLAMVVVSLFSVSCAMFDYQIVELFGGRVKAVLLVPIEIVFQLVLAKALWLTDIKISWRIGGANGGLHDGFQKSSFRTLNFGIIIPLLIVGLLLLLAGNLLTMKHKRKVRAAR